MVYKQAWAMHAESLGNPLVLGTKGGIGLSPLTLYTDMNGYMVNITPQHLPRLDTFTQKINDFVRAVRGEIENPIPPKPIVKMQYVIDGIYQSAASGKEVTIQLPAELRERARLSARCVFCLDKTNDKPRPSWRGGGQLGRFYPRFALYAG